MADYQKMYYTLFNAMSTSVETMMQAMQKVNDIYMDSPETVIVLAEESMTAENSTE